MSHDVWLLKRPADGSDPLKAMEASRPVFGSADAVRSAIEGAFPAIEWDEAGFGAVADGTHSLEVQLADDLSHLTVWFHSATADPSMEAVAGLCRSEGWLVFDEGEDWEL